MNNQTPSPLSERDVFTQVAFLRALITHLHRYGASAGRLESAVRDVSQRLGVRAEILASVTGAWLSVQDPQDPNRPITHVIRMPVGTIDLGRLADSDMVAERVASGACTAQEGLAQLVELDTSSTWKHRLLMVVCCGLVATCVPALFDGTGYADLVVSLLVGILTGLISLLGAWHWRVGEAMEAVAAFCVTLSCLFANIWLPISANIVVVAGLIALMPGMALTTAIAELSSGQLMTGVARFGGAVTSLMKLTFGAVAAFGVAKVLGWNGLDQQGFSALSTPVRMACLSFGALAFAGLFQAKPRHVLLVAASVLFGYGVSQVVQHALKDVFGLVPVGTFVAALSVTILSNFYSTLCHRPGAIVRLPGIILLVPGSIGFKAGQAFWNNEAMHGAEQMLLALGTIIALVAGILMGNLLVSARRML